MNTKTEITALTFNPEVVPLLKAHGFYDTPHIEAADCPYVESNDPIPYEHILVASGIQCIKALQVAIKRRHDVLLIDPPTSLAEAIPEGYREWGIAIAFTMQEGIAAFPKVAAETRFSEPDGIDSLTQILIGLTIPAELDQS